MPRHVGVDCARVRTDVLGQYGSMSVALVTWTIARPT
jgi:hypothetical protein